MWNKNTKFHKRCLFHSKEHKISTKMKRIDIYWKLLSTEEKTTREIVNQNNDLPTFIEAENLRVKIMASGVLDVLPDFSDRVLLIDAAVYRCDCFCTRDWATVLKHRDNLKSIGIPIVTPSEWWNMIELYAGLWAWLLVWLTVRSSGRRDRFKANDSGE